MLHVQAITRRYGPRTVFEALSWHIGKGVRIGLVGPNGAGKTTLLKILAGIEPPDSGEVTSAKGTLIGYLPQEVETLEGETVLGQVLSGFGEVRGLEEEIERIETALAGRPDAHELERLTARYGDLRHRFEALGGYRLEGEARAIIGGLGFPSSSIHAPLTTLSGGWRMRAALAGHLLRRPDLLLLDEPTNHLDLESLAWLEEFLDDYDGSVVIVSHDRFFMNRVVDGIAELEDGRLTLYPGSYDDYVEDRESRREAILAAKKSQDRQIAQVERFIERFRYKATKARQVQSRIKQLEKVERIQIRRGPKTIHFAFPQPPRSGAETIRVEAVKKAFGENVVYEAATFAARRGERIALVGPNGAGKSTLLKILAGVLEPDAGTRLLGHNVTLHYYAQHQLEALGAGRTVLEEIETVAPDDLRPRLRTILGAFLFSGDDVDKKVGVLSGGEKARLALAKMLVRPASLLLLDEPTNHLDLRARGILEEALDQYTGTIVFISHDRYFINRIATAVCDVQAGQLDLRPGSYDGYMERVQNAARERTQGAGAPAPVPATRGASKGGGAAAPDSSGRARTAASAVSHTPGESKRAGAGVRAARSGSKHVRGGARGAREAGKRSAGPAPASPDRAGPDVTSHSAEGGAGSPVRGQDAQASGVREARTARNRQSRGHARGAARANAGHENDAQREVDERDSEGSLSSQVTGGSAGTVRQAESEPSGPKSREQKRLEAQDRERRGRETKGFKERLAAVEREIASLEARLKDVEGALADPALYRDGGRARDVSREHKEIQERIAWLYDEWAGLEESLSRF